MHGTGVDEVLAALGDYGRRVAKEYLRPCFKPLPAFCRAEIIFPAIVLCAMLRGGRIDAHATDRVNDLSGGGHGMGSVGFAAMLMFNGWPTGGSRPQKVKSLMRYKEKHIITREANNT